MESFLLKISRFLRIGLALLLCACNGTFYYPSHKVYLPPEKLKIQYEDHYFQTRDGTKIHGRVLFHSQGTSRNGLFVMFHGNAENLTSHYLQFAWILRHGYDLFVFDYAGYGQSEGEASRPSSIASGAAALDFVADSLLNASTGKLVIVGQSLGGAIMLRCLPEWKAKDKVNLILVDCSFPSYQHIAQKVLSRTWWTWPFQPLAYVLVSETGGPKRSIPRLTPTPMLVTTCKMDSVVNPRFSREIYALAREPKQLWEFDSCGHTQAFRSEKNRDRLLRFIDSVSAFKDTAHAP